MRTPPSFAARRGRVVGCAAAWSLGVALVVSLTPTPRTAAQDKDKTQSLKPIDTYAQVRIHIAEGKHDLAAIFLQKFVQSTPTDKDLLDIEERYGTTAFKMLRTVPKWSDDPKVEKQARDNVEAINKQAYVATEAVLRNPTRVNKYIRNLGATYEERAFAELELKRTGDYAIPFMVEALRKSIEPAISSGILGAIPKLEANTMAGWVAALDALEPGQQYGVLAALLSRDDFLILLSMAQTDIRPILWRFVGDPNGNPTLRKFAVETLGRMVPDFDKRLPETELTAIAKTFADRKARYQSAKVNPDGSASTVPVWVWDAKDQKLVKKDDVPVSQAEEYYGLRAARWALERRADYEPAQVMVLTLATERAVYRSNFADVAKTDPAVYKLLADAPTTVMTDLLDRSLVEKRTALVFAITQALGDRAEKEPALSAPGKPSLFERALNYPDPRVALAAANALLRSAAPVEPRLRGRVIEVLKRAAAADAGVPGTAKGQALLADPDRRRADDTAAILRSMGYDVEVFAVGRDLLRRVARSSDFDLILIDHHIPNPELVDVVGHLRADLNASRRPILVIASSDQPRPPSLDMLLLRIAGLIAATESDPTGMPAPFVPDPRMTPEQQISERATVQQRRDGVFRSTATDRLARLMRVIDTTGLELTDAQKFMLKLRAEQITFAVLAAEYPLNLEASPATLEYFRLVNKQVVAAPPVPPYIRRVGIDQLMKIAERLELDVAKVPQVQARYDRIRTGVNPADLGLLIQTTRDPAIEAKVTRLMRNMPAVTVIPEPYSRIGLEDDLKAAFADPADAPRDPAEKRAGAKLAVEWLRRMATGEVTGYDVRPAEAELVAALRVDDLAEPAIDAVARSASSEAQQALVSLAAAPTRPLPIRLKAADAAVRHIQLHGRLSPATLAGAVANLSNTEPNAEMRSRLLVLKGLLAPDPKAYVNDLKTYDPPLVPVAPKGPAPMPKDPKEPKDPKDEKEPNPKM